MTDAAAVLSRPALETLWVTDAEMIRRMGIPEKKARPLIRALDANPKSGFPPKDKLFGDRRYWPAVRAYMDEQNRRTMAASQNQRRR